MAKRKTKIEQVDGLGPEDLKKIHRALGQVRVWHYSVRLAKKRALGEDGFYRCEARGCPTKGKPVPKIHVDHKIAIGEIGGPEYLQRMFCSSKNLQVICPKCHYAKTKKDNAKTRKAKKRKNVDDFY